MQPKWTYRGIRHQYQKGTRTHNAFNQRRLPSPSFANHIQMRPQIVSPNPERYVPDLARVIHLSHAKLNVE